MGVMYVSDLELRKTLPTIFTRIKNNFEGDKK